MYTLQSTGILPVSFKYPTKNWWYIHLKILVNLCQFNRWNTQHLWRRHLHDQSAHHKQITPFSGWVRLVQDYKWWIQQKKWLADSLKRQPDTIQTQDKKYQRSASNRTAPIWICERAEYHLTPKDCMDNKSKTLLKSWGLHRTRSSNRKVTSYNQKHLMPLRWLDKKITEQSTL